MALGSNPIFGGFDSMVDGNIVTLPERSAARPKACSLICASLFLTAAAAAPNARRRERNRRWKSVCMWCPASSLMMRVPEEAAAVDPAFRPRADMTRASRTAGPCKGVGMTLDAHHRQRNALRTLALVGPGDMCGRATRLTS